MGQTWDEIGAVYDTSGDNIRKWASRQSWFDEIREEEKITEKNRPSQKLHIDGETKTRRVVETVKLYEETDKTPEKIMSMLGYSLDEWKFKDFKLTKYGKEDSPMYSVKMELKPLDDGELHIDKFLKLMRKEPEPMEIEMMGVGERNLVIGLADLHFGVTSYEYLKEQLAEVMDIVSNGYDTIAVEQLGDLFHSSQMKETITLKGTILPTVDMVKAWQDAKSFYYALIDHCAKYANKVQIEHAAGNHSGNLEFAFLDLIKDRYSLLKNNRVEVNNHNDWRVAYRLGNVGILISHGDTVKIQDLPDIFARDYKMLWGNTEQHEVHAGHKHNKFKEFEAKNGTVIRQFPTPKPTDDYEDKFGYGSRKMIELIEYDEDRSRNTYEI